MRAILLFVLTGVLLVSLAGCKNSQNPAGHARVASASKIPIAESVKSAALAAPTASGAGFVRLSPDECGISFLNELKNDDVKVGQMNTQTGLASGDYDNDGDLDVFLVGNTNANALYRNEGGFQFKDVTAETAPEILGDKTLGSGALFADVDGDRNLDLYICNKDADNQLFMGDGSGKFTEEGVKRGAANKYASVMAATFDADRDGDLDMYIANYRLTSGSATELSMITPAKRGEKVNIPEEFKGKYYVDEGGMPRLLPDPGQFLLNDGKGNFTDDTAHAGLECISWTLQPLACDFNNDGWTDLFISSDMETPDRLFINNQDGTFTERAKDMLRKTALYGMGADTGDINNDGLPDMFVGDMLSRDYKRAKRQSGDMYQWRWELTNGAPQPQMRNMMYVNRGDGYMTEMAQMVGVDASEWTWSARIDDLNSDGLSEISVTTGFIRDAMDKDVLDNLTNIIQAGKKDEIRGYILQQPVYKSLPFIFTATEPLKYKLADDNFGINEESFSGGASHADYDGDGDLDIIINNTDAPLGVFRNDMPQGKMAVLELRAPAPNTHAVGARVWAHCGEDVYMQDVIVARGYATGESGRVHLGLGTHDTIDKLEIRWPDGTMQEHSALAAGNFYTIEQAAGLTEWKPLAIPALMTQSELPFEQKEKVTEPEDYKLEPLLPFQVSMNGTGAGVADYDGDGNLDVYFCGPSGQAGSLYKGDGKGGFTADSQLDGKIPVESEEMSALWFDANGDAKPDLLVTCGGQEDNAGSATYKPHLFINNLPTGFEEREIPVKPASLGAAAAGDIDSDGDLDLVLAGHLLYHRFAATAPSYVLENDGQGNFRDGMEKLAPGFGKGGQITDLAFADFSGDGKLDLAVSQTWAGVEIWNGDGAKLTKGAALTPNGYWSGLGCGDFDNDGDMDLMAGNLGNNTKYHPKDGAPVTLYANDFDKNGTRDLIEVKFRKDGCMLPGRGRSCSGYAIGYIPQKWPTWASFADATLEDVYGEGLKTAEKFTSADIHSKLLLNNGDGSFAVSDLPGTAQWAPVFGIGVGDFNRDGNLDAILANNTDAPQCEAGRWDIGYSVLLLGDGKGGFEDLSRAASGISIIENARGVIPADYNGDGALDALISMSNGKARMAAGAESKGSALSVSLKGKAPNTAAVGAKLTLTLSDGRKLTRTVQAGSGYMSSYSGPQNFGIPDGVTASSLDVVWPDGTAGNSTDLASGKVELTQ